MLEDEVVRTLLSVVDREERTISVELERCVGRDEEMYARADVVFPQYDIAIECKGDTTEYDSKSQRHMLQGMGQASMYSACGYESYLCIPDDSVTAALYDTICQSSVGLIGVEARNQVRDEEKLYLYRDQVGGWPFESISSNRPPYKVSKESREANQLLVGGVAQGKWKSEI